MKNKIKRNKILPLLICGSAIASLGSVAFSTWVISWNQSESIFQASVNVQGYVHNTILCEGEYNVDNIILDNKEGANDEVISKNGENEVDTPSLSVEVIIPTTALEKIKEENEASSENLNSLKVGEVELSLNAIVDGKDNNIGSSTTEFSRLGYEYLKLNTKSIALNYGDFTDYKVVNGYVYVNKDIEVSISYGSFFNNTSPQTFYDSIIETSKNDYQNNKITKDAYLLTLNSIKDELSDFKNALNNQNISIDLKAVIYGINNTNS